MILCVATVAKHVVLPVAHSWLGLVAVGVHLHFVLHKVSLMLLLVVLLVRPLVLIILPRMLMRNRWLALEIVVLE